MELEDGQTSLGKGKSSGLQGQRRTRRICSRDRKEFYSIFPIVSVKSTTWQLPVGFSRWGQGCFYIWISGVCVLSCVWLFVTPWTVPCQYPLSMKILQARILEWGACSLPGDLLNPRIKPRTSALQVDSLLSEPAGKAWSFVKLISP